MGQLVSRNAWMLFRHIARHGIPGQAHYQPGGGAEPERSPPAVMGDDPGKQRDAEPRARANAGEDPAVRAPSFGYRNPPGHKLIRGRVDDGFSRAERKPYQYQNH